MSGRTRFDGSENSAERKMEVQSEAGGREGSLNPDILCDLLDERALARWQRVLEPGIALAQLSEERIVRLHARESERNPKSGVRQILGEPGAPRLTAVSYTHLTLPTKA